MILTTKISVLDAIVERSDFEYYEVDKVELPSLGVEMRARLKRSDGVKTCYSQDSRL